MKFKKGHIQGGVGNFNDHVWTLEFATKNERDVAVAFIKRAFELVEEAYYGPYEGDVSGRRKSSNLQGHRVDLAYGYVKWTRKAAAFLGELEAFLGELEALRKNQQIR